MSRTLSQKILSTTKSLAKIATKVTLATSLTAGLWVTGKFFTLDRTKEALYQRKLYFGPELLARNLANALKKKAGLMREQQPKNRPIAGRSFRKDPKVVAQKREATVARKKADAERAGQAAKLQESKTVFGAEGPILGQQIHAQAKKGPSKLSDLTNLGNLGAAGRVEIHGVGLSRRPTRHLRARKAGLDPHLVKVRMLAELSKAGMVPTR